MRPFIGVLVLLSVGFCVWLLLRDAPVVPGGAPSAGSSAAPASGADVPAAATREEVEEAVSGVARSGERVDRAAIESLLAGQQVDDAAERLQASDLEATDPVRYHLLMSEVYLLKEDYPMALGAADNVVALDPANAEGFYQRAQARVGIEEYREAIDDITRFIELTDDPDLRAHAIEQREAWLEVYRPPGPPGY